MILRLTVFTIGLALGAAAQAFAQLSTPGPAPQAPPQTSTPVPAQEQPSTSPSQQPIPTAAPTAIPTTPPTPTPTATPASPYKYIVEVPNTDPAPDAPQIIRIEMNDKTLHPGGPLSIRITVSPNVSKMYVSAAGQQLEILKAQEGLFGTDTKLPGFIPFWFFRTYDVTFTAQTQEGKKTTYTIPITLGR